MALKWKWSYLLNPLGALADLWNDNRGVSPEAAAYKREHNGSLDGYVSTGDQINSAFSKVWDDLTGKSQIELQNQLNREVAEEEYQRNLQSIGDTAAAYEAAGFNRNLMYNQSPAQYNAPNLTAYSGTQKLDRILQKTGQVLSMLPAMYQATAALEGIDQARERTKQSEIKTMSMGMNLLDQGYKLGDTFLSKPFTVQFRNGMNPLYYMYPTDRGQYSYNGKLLSQGDLGTYADAALKHQFDLLESIGIKNQMNSTLNNWRGYQYSLDRRFGAAGRIVGMGAQGLGAVGKLFSPIKLKTSL